MREKKPKTAVMGRPPLDPLDRVVGIKVYVLPKVARSLEAERDRMVRKNLLPKGAPVARAVRAILTEWAG